jgi:hypothetical protein
LVSLAQLMGAKMDKFGDAALNKGPITQLFAT